MIEISKFMDQYLAALETRFKDRIWFVGLQGSYGRGEATETSDIDVVVILDSLSAGDLTAYSSMLDTLPHRELLCGFLSGREELENWDPSDLFQFCRDTTPIRGSLDKILSSVSPADLDRAIKTGACGLYHGCVHNMLYEKSPDILKGLYKSASFLIQALHFKRTSSYVRLLKELLPAVPPEESQALQIFLELKKGGEIRFQEMSEALFLLAGTWIREGKSPWPEPVS